VDKDVGGGVVEGGGVGRDVGELEVVENGSSMVSWLVEGVSGRLDGGVDKDVGEGVDVVEGGGVGKNEMEVVENGSKV
jgi:hypothetical protein